ncbi:hypothetical protein GQ457_03G023660 [Hibiscus cannabinus]
MGGNEGLRVEAGSLELSFGLELCVFKGFYLFLGTRRETSSFRVTPSWPLDKGENRDDKNIGCKVEVMFLRCLSRKPSTLLRKSPFAVATWAMVRSQAISDDTVEQAFSNKRVSVRLDESNFLLWKQQVILMMRDHGLEGYLDKMISTSARLVTNCDGSRSANPMFLRFVKQDKSLTSWLLSTINHDILPQLVGAETSADIWDAVTRLYSKLSTTKSLIWNISLPFSIVFRQSTTLLLLSLHPATCISDPLRCPIRINTVKYNKDTSGDRRNTNYFPVVSKVVPGLNVNYVAKLDILSITIDPTYETFGSSSPGPTATTDVATDSTMQVNTFVTSTVLSTTVTWFPDSGAMHHVIAQPNMLHRGTSYSGPASVPVSVPTTSTSTSTPIKTSVHNELTVVTETTSKTAESDSMTNGSLQEIPESEDASIIDVDAPSTNCLQPVDHGKPPYVSSPTILMEVVFDDFMNEQTPSPNCTASNKPSPEHTNLGESVLTPSFPINVDNAPTNTHHMITRMLEEYNALLAKDTWELVKLPEGRKTIGCK